MRALLRPFLFLLGLATLLWLAWDSRKELARLPSGFVAGWFVLALGVGVAFILAQGVMYVWLMRKHGSPAAPRALLVAFLASQPGKYVPGRIWGAAMQISHLGRDAATGTGVAGIFVANADLMALAAAHSLGLGVVLAVADRPWLLVPALAALLAGSVLLVRQRWIAELLTYVGHRFPRLAPPSLPMSDTPPPTGRTAALTVLLLFLNVVAAAAIVLSQGGVDTSRVLPLLAAIYLGWTAGYLALPVPAGIGVREASAVAFAHWLVPDMAADTVVAVALIARLWQLGVDVLAIAVAASLNWRR